MRNAYLMICLFGAAACFLLSALELYMTRTDWFTVMVSYGFMIMFCLLSLLFDRLSQLGKKFDNLTRILSETFTKLAAIQQENFKHYNSYGQTPSNITVTFQGNGVKWDKAAVDAMDFMSLEQLETERKRAEKEENYEKAAMIQKKIDQRRSKF